MVTLDAHALETTTGKIRLADVLCRDRLNPSLVGRLVLGLVLVGEVVVVLA